MIDFRLLVKAGVHFGHQSSRWCPRMAPYIWGKRNGVHLIDISKTAVKLEQAAQFLETTAKEGKTILWIGTKKPAQQAIKDAASVAGMPCVTHRWIGGTLTNHLQVKKSITKFLHLGDVVKKADIANSHYTKKEVNSFQKRLDRLEKNVGGIVKMRWPIGALVVVDVRKEASAVKEAVTMGIPVVALVDTNSDPRLVSYVIPTNEDAPKAIQVIVDYLAQATAKGKEVFEKEQKDAHEKEQILLKEAKKKETPKEAPKKEAAPVKAAAEPKAEAKKEVAEKVVAPSEAKK